MYQDKIAGSLIGLAVGDALGVPHEFKTQRLDNYTGKLEIVPIFIFRFGKRTDVIGQYSDDTDMALCNLRSIIRNRGYNREDVILSYLRWAETSKAMGKNTRALMKGVKTVNGYQSRWNKIFQNTDVATWTQSNGSLMRCSMLAFLPNYIDVIIMDCMITNPHVINIHCNLAYSIALRYTAMGIDKKKIIETLTIQNEYLTIYPDVKEVILNAVSNRDFSRNLKAVGKGWVLHALYCAFWGWYHFESYQEPIDIIIKQGGDTDTNAAITGALIGANLGYNKLLQEERTKFNINVVRNADFNQGENPRADEYCLKDFDFLICSYSMLIGELK